MISALEQDSSPIRKTSFFPNPVVKTTFVPSSPPQAVSPVTILMPSSPAINTAVILHLFLKNIAFPTFSKSLNSDYTLFLSSMLRFLISSENSKNSPPVCPLREAFPLLPHRLCIPGFSHIYPMPHSSGYWHCHPGNGTASRSPSGILYLPLSQS